MITELIQAPMGAGIRRFTIDRIRERYIDSRNVAFTSTQREIALQWQGMIPGAIVMPLYQFLTSKQVWCGDLLVVDFVAPALRNNSARQLHALPYDVWLINWPGDIKQYLTA